MGPVTQGKSSYTGFFPSVMLGMEPRAKTHAKQVNLFLDV